MTATVRADGRSGTDELFTVPFYHEKEFHSFIKIVEHGWKEAGLIKANVSYRHLNGGNSCYNREKWILPTLDKDTGSHGHYFENYFDRMED